MTTYDWERIAGDRAGKIEEMRVEITRLNLIMPHIGATCKHQGAEVKHISLYHFCKHPDSAEKLGCEDNMPCFNGEWELKD